MIFINGIYLIVTIIIIIFILLFYIYLIFSGIFAYRKNAQRETDDPEKKDLSPLTPWLTPFTPFIWLGTRMLLAPWTIVFGIFLILFPFILFIFRPIPDDTALKRSILKVGNSVLKINSRFLYALGFHPKPSQFSA